MFGGTLNLTQTSVSSHTNMCFLVSVCLSLLSCNTRSKTAAHNTAAARTEVCVLIGVGGQIDFMRGAALGLDGLGKPILAMPSATKKGESKIVPVLKQGQ